MKEKNFENLLARTRQKTLPDCPATLEQNVLRKIRLQNQQAKGGLVIWLNHYIFELGWAVPILAIAIVLSTITTSVTVSYESKSVPALAAALGFESIVNVPELMPFSNTDT